MINSKRKAGKKTKTSSNSTKKEQGSGRFLTEIGVVT